ncbi:uncharacterized protein LOC134267589 [Saccostrea cucullata]|uniref:uncharacterized protein LOC134267589 n=1 Tax=Saccostrea cuccullata TaxID=36930 RepID=UPI002ED21156
MTKLQPTPQESTRAPQPSGSSLASQAVAESLVMTKLQPTPQESTTLPAPQPSASSFTPWTPSTPQPSASSFTPWTPSTPQPSVSSFTPWTPSTPQPSASSFTPWAPVTVSQSSNLFTSVLYGNNDQLSCRRCRQIEAAVWQLQSAIEIASTNLYDDHVETVQPEPMQADTLLESLPSRPVSQTQTNVYNGKTKVNFYLKPIVCKILCIERTVTSCTG